MAVSDTIKCQSCGRKMTKQRSAEPDAPKAGYECSQCHQWVCGDCTDWNASDTTSRVCSRCSGRAAPSKGGCDPNLPGGMG